MEDKIVTLTSYYDPMEAQIVRGRLEANGISCFIADDNTLAANPFYNQALGGIKIKVFEHDLEKCREILAEDVVLESGDELMTCPYCKSTQVRYGVAPVKRSWFSIILTVLVSPHAIHPQQSWTCRDCGANFNSPKNELPFGRQHDNS
jgi:DNA-directed RNA polymerase subunit RPC12/RpoP